MMKCNAGITSPWLCGQNARKLHSSKDRPIKDFQLKHQLAEWSTDHKGGAIHQQTVRGSDRKHHRVLGHPLCRQASYDDIFSYCRNSSVAADAKGDRLTKHRYAFALSTSSKLANRIDVLEYVYQDAGTRMCALKTHSEHQHHTRLSVFDANDDVDSEELYDLELPLRWLLSMLSVATPSASSVESDPNMRSGSTRQ